MVSLISSRVLWKEEEEIWGGDTDAIDSIKFVNKENYKINKCTILFNKLKKQQILISTKVINI
jgi:hypothetical protein